MRVCFLIVFFVTILYTETLDEKISRMMKAPPSERFKLMNAIKHDIIQLKAKERIAALKRLLKATHNQNTKKAIDEILKRQNDNAKRRNKDSKRYIRTETHTENSIENTLDTHQTTEIDNENFTPYEEHDDDD